LALSVVLALGLGGRGASPREILPSRSTSPCGTAVTKKPGTTEEARSCQPIMDEARALLDSLMGHTRNQDAEEAAKYKGENFTSENNCKHFLLGFCPQYELGHGKFARRNLGDCSKSHSEAMRTEFNAHPEKDKFQKEYEKALIPVLESCVREADAWVARERANVQKAERQAREKAGQIQVPQSVKDTLVQLNTDVDKMMASAEELAEKGEVESSKFKVILADEIKAKVKEIEAKHDYGPQSIREEWVCDICGTRTEAATTDTRCYSAHITGQVHLGYMKIREWLGNLRDKAKGIDGGSRDEDRDRSKRDRSSSKRRGSRSREAKPRSSERDRRRSPKRSRSKDDKRERDRRRSRSRGRDRSRSRGRDRSRSRARDRSRSRRRR